MIIITDEEIKALEDKYGDFKHTKYGALILRLIAAYKEQKAIIEDEK